MPPHAGWGRCPWPKHFLILLDFHPDAYMLVPVRWAGVTQSRGISWEKPQCCREAPLWVSCGRCVNYSVKPQTSITQAFLSKHHRLCFVLHVRISLNGLFKSALAPRVGSTDTRRSWLRPAQGTARGLGLGWTSVTAELTASPSVTSDQADTRSPGSGSRSRQSCSHASHPPTRLPPSLIPWGIVLHCRR